MLNLLGMHKASPTPFSKPKYREELFVRHNKTKQNPPTDQRASKIKEKTPYQK